MKLISLVTADGRHLSFVEDSHRIVEEENIGEGHLWLSLMENNGWSVEVTLTDNYLAVQGDKIVFVDDPVAWEIDIQLTTVSFKLIGDGRYLDWGPKAKKLQLSKTPVMFRWVDREMLDRFRYLDKKRVHVKLPRPQQGSAELSRDALAGQQLNRWCLDPLGVVYVDNEESLTMALTMTLDPNSVWVSLSSSTDYVAWNKRSKEFHLKTFQGKQPPHNFLMVFAEPGIVKLWTSGGFVQLHADGINMTLTNSFDEGALFWFDVIDSSVSDVNDSVLVRLEKGTAVFTLTFDHLFCDGFEEPRSFARMLNDRLILLYLDTDHVEGVVGHRASQVQKAPNQREQPTSTTSSSSAVEMMVMASEPTLMSSTTDDSRSEMKYDVLRFLCKHNKKDLAIICSEEFAQEFHNTRWVSDQKHKCDGSGLLTKRRASNGLICSKCGERITDQAFVCSTPGCSYALHSACVPERDPSLVRVVIPFRTRKYRTEIGLPNEHAEFSPQCTQMSLHLKQQPPTQLYGCDKCGLDGVGRVYECLGCQFRLHPRCVAVTELVSQQSSSHALLELFAVFKLHETPVLWYFDDKHFSDNAEWTLHDRLNSQLPTRTQSFKPVKHLNHPDHDLIDVYLPDTVVCSDCSLPVDGKVYHCPNVTCNYIIHTTCLQENTWAAYKFFGLLKTKLATVPIDRSATSGYFCDKPVLIHKVIVVLDNDGICGIHVKGFACIPRDDSSRGDDDDVGGNTAWGDTLQWRVRGSVHGRPMANKPSNSTTVQWTLFKHEVIESVTVYYDKVVGRDGVALGLSIRTRNHKFPGANRINTFGSTSSGHFEQLDTEPGEMVVGFLGNIDKNTNLCNLGILKLKLTPPALMTHPSSAVVARPVLSRQDETTWDLEPAVFEALCNFRREPVSYIPIAQRMQAHYEYAQSRADWRREGGEYTPYEATMRILREVFTFFDTDCTESLEFEEMALCFSVLFDPERKASTEEKGVEFQPSSEIFGREKVTFEEFVYLFYFLAAHIPVKPMKPVYGELEFVHLRSEVDQEQHDKDSCATTLWVYMEGLAKKVLSMCLLILVPIFTPISTALFVALFIPALLFKWFRKRWKTLILIITVLDLVSALFHLPFVGIYFYSFFRTRDMIGPGSTVFEAIVPAGYQIFLYYAVNHVFWKALRAQDSKLSRLLEVMFGKSLEAVNHSEQFDDLMLWHSGKYCEFVARSLLEGSYSKRLWADDIQTEIHRAVSNEPSDAQNVARKRKTSMFGFAIRYLLPALFAGVHMCLPGVFRILRYKAPFFGSTLGQRVITMMWFVEIPILTWGFCFQTQVLIEDFFRLRRRLIGLAAICNASEAKVFGLDYFIDLTAGDNVRNWILLRKWMVRQELDMSSHWSIIIPTFALDLAMALTVVIRVILRRSASVMAVTTLDVILVFNCVMVSIYLIVLVGSIVAVNDVLGTTHLKLLKHAQRTISHRLGEQLAFDPNVVAKKKVKGGQDYTALEVIEDSDAEMEADVEEVGMHVDALHQSSRDQVKLQVIEQAQRSMEENDQAFKLVGLPINRGLIASIITTLAATAATSLFSLVPVPNSG